MADEVEEAVEFTVQEAIEFAFQAIENIIQRIEDIENFLVAQFGGKQESGE